MENLQQLNTENFNIIPRRQILTEESDEDENLNDQTEDDIENLQQPEESLDNQESDFDKIKNLLFNETLHESIVTEEPANDNIFDEIHNLLFNSTLQESFNEINNEENATIFNKSCLKIQKNH